MRLQKFLSAAGVCSRRHAETLIAEGRIRVNGQVVTQPGTKVDPEKDAVTYNNKPVRIEALPLYIALNKPRGYVTSCRHTGKKIVLDLVDAPGRIYPVGRLDEDSEGLLLLTNDGPMHHRLLHPSFDHEKEYDVTVRSPISDVSLRKMAQGMMIDDRKTRPAVVKRISTVRFLIVLKEGRKRQVRRMVKNTGNTVSVLKRVRFGAIRLKGLKPGAWRYLTEKEIKSLTATHTR